LLRDAGRFIYSFKNTDDRGGHPLSPLHPSGTHSSLTSDFANLFTIFKQYLKRHFLHTNQPRSRSPYTTISTSASSDYMVQ